MNYKSCLRVKAGGVQQRSWASMMAPSPNRPLIFLASAKHSTRTFVPSTLLNTTIFIVEYIGKNSNLGLMMLLRHYILASVFWGRFQNRHQRQITENVILTMQYQTITRHSALAEASKTLGCPITKRDWVCMYLSNFYAAWFPMTLGGLQQPRQENYNKAN